MPEQPEESVVEGKKKKPKKRRLRMVRVDEISLVDEPAVQQAIFTIVKREANPGELYPGLKAALGGEVVAKETETEVTPEIETYKFVAVDGREIEIALRLNYSDEELETEGAVFKSVITAIRVLKDVEDLPELATRSVAALMSVALQLKSEETLKSVDDLADDLELAVHGDDDDEEEEDELGKGMGGRFLALADFKKINEAQELLGSVVKSAKKITKALDAEVVVKRK